MRVLLTLVALAVSACAQTTVINGAGGGGATPAGADGSVQIKAGTSLGAAAIQAATASEVTGVELVTNGTFAAGLSGWTVSGDGTGWVLDGSGHPHHVPGSNFNYLQQTVTISQDNAYLMKVQVVSQTAGSASFYLGDGCNSDCSGNFSAGLNVYAAGAYSDNGATVIQIAPTSDSDVTITSVSLIYCKPAYYLPTEFNTNVALGAASLASNTAGTDNFSGGFASLQRNTTGSSNVAAGSNSLFSNTTGSHNSAHGGFTLYNNTSGDSNVADGLSALRNNVTGSYNVAVGRNALFTNIGGSFNVVQGCDAMFESDASNSVVAFLAPSVADGCNSQSGFPGTQKNASNSVLIGTMDVTGINSNSGTPLTNVIAIGGTATQSNQTVIGNSSTTSSTFYGGAQIVSNTSQPTCAVAVRGMLWVTQSGAGVKDAVQVCAKDAANAYAWRTIY